MIMKTAPKEGNSMLSGVASDRETMELADKFSNGELVRMLGLIQETSAGFTRSTSRRLDAELCVLNLCQPELVLNVEAMNARISRLEEQIRSGNIAVKMMPLKENDDDIQQNHEPENEMQPEAPAISVVDEAPIGFWTDVAADVRRELRPPVSGFFAAAPNAPVKGVLKGTQLVLLCANTFTMEVVNKPEILSLVARKASARLNVQIRVTAVDQTAKEVKSEQMEQLLQFGRNHADIVNIKDN